MTRIRHHPTPTASRGFTLIELIGVLAILVIIGTLATETVSTRIRITHRSTEQQNLDRIGTVFRQQILQTRSIPTTGSWHQFVAGSLGVSPSQTLTNRIGNTRILRFDPAFRVGPDARSPATASAVIQQTSQGSINPIQPRAVLISSTADPLPDISPVSFDALWNCTPDSFPAGWPPWTSTASDLHISRIDLRNLFNRVLLQNNDLVREARYSIQSPTDSQPISQGMAREMWVYKGSILYLTQSDNTLQAAEVVRDEVSFVFEGGRWNRRVILGRDPQSGSFADLSDAFLGLAAPPPTDAQHGATQQSVIEEMYHFMVQYARWAARDFPGGSGSASQVPEYRTLTESAGRLGTFSLNLLGAN
jgi:prepilin-type N-terminal cleavage/methylation domain-containing protein